MKKILTCAAAIAIIMAISASSVLAAGRHGTSSNNGAGMCIHKNCSSNFTDENNDGICDNFETSGNSQNFVDENNDGIGDNYSQEQNASCNQKGSCKRSFFFSSSQFCNKFQIN